VNTISQLGVGGAVVVAIIYALAKLIPIIGIALNGSKGQQRPFIDLADYITRSEYESRHQDIRDSLARIETKVDRLRQ
jgi:hypothetical protein